MDQRLSAIQKVALARFDVAMTTIRTLSLLGATLTMGLATGAFALYAHTIMPGLKKTDDRTFVAAFQSMDRAIINPWFMLTAFLGALALTRGGGCLEPRARRRCPGPRSPSASTWSR